MEIEKFEIENFKGIQKTTVEIPKRDGARAVTLIGLNESGKTTLLQAIHSFSPDQDSKVILEGVSGLEYSPEDLIPKSNVSNFSGDVSVTAFLRFSDREKDELVDFCRRSLELVLDIKSVPDLFSIRSYTKFRNSDFVKKGNIWSIYLQGRGRRSKKNRLLTGEENSKIYKFLRAKIPRISYFPTFVFEFPERIYLSGRDDDPSNVFYRNVFQDILDFQGESLTIDEHIVGRLRKSTYHQPWHLFFPTFHSSSDRRKIEQVMDKASAAVSRVIFQKWNEIFGDRIEKYGKDIIIEFHTEDGGDDGSHNCYIDFKIKDGSERYLISDRSLGFRWFFCFLLFTQFRSYRKESPGSIFLLDEPASNLHATAQQKLLESLPAICSNPNVLMYSTHSHYMIEPKWLENAYIISNDGVDYDKDLSTFSYGVSVTDVKAVRYREFLNKFPSRVSYFQPVLDRLNVKPSQIEFSDGCLIVEGKSDYFIINAAANSLGVKKVKIIPGFGATTLDPLISLFRGWGYKFLLLLDGDAEGIRAKKTYQERYALGLSEIAVLGELTTGVKEVENFLVDKDVQEIKKFYNINKNPTKKQILNYFQELLFSGEKIKISSESRKKFSDFFDGVKKRIE